MRNHLDIVRALLSKTVVRGATVGEEAAAVAKAVELIGKHMIPHSAVASIWPTNWGYDGKLIDWKEEQRKREPKPDPKPVVSTGTIGNYARQLLLREIAGRPYSYVWIIESIQLKYPHAKTTVASLRWYENELRKQGRTVPTKRPAK